MLGGDIFRWELKIYEISVGDDTVDIFEGPSGTIDFSAKEMNSKSIDNDWCFLQGTHSAFRKKNTE